MERINKQRVFNFYNKKNKWLGIIDYKTLFFFVAYLLIVFKILNIFNIQIIIKLYIYIIAVLPLVIFILFNLQEESIIEKLKIILIFFISRNIYVSSQNTTFTKNMYVKNVEKWRIEIWYKKWYNNPQLVGDLFMKFIQKNKLELGDTLVPDLFILNNMKSLNEIDIKVYIYVLYLLKKGADVDSDMVIKDLDLTDEEFKTSIEVLQAEGLLQKTTRGIVVVDLKESEINKSYIPKFDGKQKRYENVIDEKRKAAVEAICESFFGGYMSYNWSIDIGNLFNMYSFEEEVMIALFQYCKERNALNRKYVFAVAETWHNGGVKTFEELENFLENYDKFSKIKQKISKALSLGRSLSKYEEVYVKKWIEDYGYDFDIIEEGLKRSTATTNPSIKYIDAIISSWYKKGLKTVDEINESENPKETVEKKTTVKRISSEPRKKSYQSYSQREYDSSDDFYDEI